MSLLLPLVLACTASDPADPAASGELLFTEDHNYGLDLDIELRVVEVAEYVDLTFDWSGVEQDLVGRPATADMVEVVTLLRLAMDVDSIEAKLAKGGLHSADLSGLWAADVAAVDGAAPLSEFAFVGTDFWPEGELQQLPEDSTWVLAASSSDSDEYPDAPGAPYLGVVALLPGSDTPPVDVALADGSGTVTASADFHPKGRLVASASAPVPVLDWSQAGEGHGNSSPPESDVVVELLHFPGTVEDAEDAFVDLRELADQRYIQQGEEGYVGDGCFDLGALVRADTLEPFEGFSTDGTWLVAFGGQYDFDPRGAPPYGAVIEVVE